MERWSRLEKVKQPLARLPDSAPLRILFLLPSCHREALDVSCIQEARVGAAEALQTALLSADKISGVGKFDNERVDRHYFQSLVGRITSNIMSISEVDFSTIHQQSFPVQTSELHII